MSVSVAIVGSGPGGFYTADALLRSGADCRIDIIERLPTPFGLIRDGVAPDHQSIKKVWKSFERTALDQRVRYYGNVKVGRDVHLHELRALYDAVVLAVGAPLDRRLGIPGEDKQGVVGSGAFVGWYNAHPDFVGLDPGLDTTAVAVIGNGNVAIDVVRVLAKTPAEMAASDLPDYAADAIHKAPITELFMFGRRGPLEAKFTNVELREMGRLENCAPLVHPSQLPDGVGDLPDRERRLKEKNLATLREFAAMTPDGRAKRLHFCFYAAPAAILGGKKVEGLRLERTRIEAGRAVGTGEFFEVACGLVVAAIGYRAEPLEGMPFDEKRGIAVNSEGRVADGVYAVGWIKRGPTGVIGTNKPDGELAAKYIRADFPRGGKPGREEFESLLRAKGVRWVTYPEWQTIDRAESANARPGAPRRKFLSVEKMLAVIDKAPARAGTG